VLTDLVGIVQNRGYQALCNLEDVSLELDLPSTWDEYLATLTRKQRHEVRRKLRRLWEAGNVNYHCLKVSREIGDFINTFLKLFSLGNQEKANFMTPRMASFFRSLADTMTEDRLLRFGILKLDNLPTAIVMSFDYNDCVYLYNSGYDPQYSSLSVGLLCKVLCIKEGIKEGKKRFDFLKGNEPYKYYLGGREVPLYRCQITIK
jgi:CelD/BcsL family acetyltransferase involved in cellulose biosynthesis